MTTTTVAPHRSTKVRGYVKAALRVRTLGARWGAAQERVVPLKRKYEAACVEMNRRRAALTGTQLAAAQRLLRQPAIDVLATPCKGT